MAALTKEEYDKRIAHLRLLHADMPEIWSLITSSRCCPSHIGLTDHCRFEEGYQCETCWLSNLPKDREV